MLGAGGAEIVNLPRGSSVLPHKHTRDILKSYNFPSYAKGTDDTSVFDIFTKGAKSFWNSSLEKSGIYKDVTMPNWFPSTRKILGKISGGVIEKLKKEMDKFLSFDNFRGGGAEMARKAIIQALGITGQSMSWLPFLMTVANKESSFNPRAINLWDINAKRGIPSKGMFQTIDPTFKRWKLSGMDDIYNPLHNAVSAIRYMVGRYGGIGGHPAYKSMARGGGYKPYSEGGVIDEEQIALLGEDNKEEVVIPMDRHKSRSMDLLAYANLRLGVFERFERFFEDMLFQMKDSTKDISVTIFESGKLTNDKLNDLSINLSNSTVKLGENLTSTISKSANTSSLSIKDQVMKLRDVVEHSKLDDDSFRVNSLLSYQEGYYQAEDGSWVKPSFYGNNKPNTRRLSWESQLKELQDLIEGSSLDDDSFFMNGLLSYKKGYVQAEDGSYVPPSFYDSYYKAFNLPNPNQSTVSTTNNTNNNNNYEIHVNYSGNGNENDIYQLAQQIRKELERVDGTQSRSYGVIA